MQVSRKLAEQELLLNIETGRGLEEAARQLYAEYFDSLAGYVQYNSGSREDAEDIFQEVVVSFINLVQKGKFRGESSVKTFLYSMNRHLWLNELKRRGRAQAREEKYEQAQVTDLGDVVDQMTDRESGERLMQVVDALGEPCRKILLLYYFENMPMKQIVEHTDYENEQVTRNKKYKCLKKLGEMLDEDPVLKQQLKSMLDE